MKVECSNEFTSGFSELIDLSTRSIQWSRDASKNSRRLELDNHDNQEFFLRTRLAARKLCASSKRPPCVGVFGPSQAGKSYLVSTLAQAENKPLSVRFGSQDIDFLQKINPGGGRESTGVVTRFSLQPPKYAADDFPVEIRLLSETDVLKILFNSFFSDLDHTGNLRLNKPTDEEISERLRSVGAKVATNQVEGGLAAEDVLDLRYYLEQSFKSLVDNLSAEFWSTAVEIVPRLALDDRAHFFSIIWRDSELFTQLYLKLARAIKSLGYPTECMAPLSALLASQDSPGIVDAQLLSMIDGPESWLVKVKPIVNERLGDEISIEKSLLAALTSELRLTIGNARWDFLNHSDILDFPGARSRLRLNDLSSSTHDGKSLAAELLLRGKVAYLFHRYTVDHELSSVVLCVPWGPQEVTGYAPLIDHWVRESQGHTPSDRAKRHTGLLLVLTKFDIDLQSKGGDSETTERLRWPDRIKSSLLERFGGFDWVEDWDGLPFRNLFWLRNPEIKDSPYMVYQGGVEIGINDAQRARLSRLRDFFAEDALVTKHFADPLVRWDAAMTPRDGGISIIVDNINRASEPKFHLDCLRGKLSSLSESMLLRLKQYFNESQDAEITRKISLFNSIKNDLAPLIRAREIWQLYELFLPSTTELRHVYYSVAKEEKVLAKSGGPVGEENFDLEDFFESEIGSADSSKNEKSPAVHNRAIDFAEKCTEFFVSRLRKLASDGVSQSQLLASEKSVQSMIEELALAAQRLKLSQTLAEALNPAESNAGVTWEAIVDRQVNITRNSLGEFLGQLGMSSLPLRERPGVPPDSPQRRVFQPYMASSDAACILNEKPINVASVIALDWLISLQQLLKDNVGFSGVDSLTPEQNAALGVLVGDIAATNPSTPRL